MYKPELKLSEMISRRSVAPELRSHGSSPEDSRADSLVSTHGTLAPSPPHVISPTDTMGSSLGVSPVLGNLADEGINKRRRNQLKPYQLRVLNRVLEHTAFPTKEVRDELSRMINVPPKSIQIWFQNQRQKAKSQMREAKQQQQPRNGGSDFLPHAKVPINPPMSNVVFRDDASASTPWPELLTTFSSPPSCLPAAPIRAPSSSSTFVNGTIPPHLGGQSSDASPFLISPSLISSPLYERQKLVPDPRFSGLQRLDHQQPQQHYQIGHHHRGSRDDRAEAISLPSPLRSPMESDLFFAAGQLPPLFEEIESGVTSLGLAPNGAFRADLNFQSNYYCHVSQQGNPSVVGANPNEITDFFDSNAW